MQERFERFGKYIIVERIGGGASADVFLVEEEGEHGVRPRFALKRMKPMLSSDPEYVTTFLDEARLGVLLKHSNIVEIIGVSSPGEVPYLVMSYIDGITLRQLLHVLRQQRVKLPLPLVLEIAMAICKALAYAHSERDRTGRPLNLIHRDLKPENILLSRDGEVKVVDFGIAKAESNWGGTLGPGVALGTIAYMSPEQAERAIASPETMERSSPDNPASLTLDSRSDLYSFGTILFEMLTLERLYPKTDLMLLSAVAIGEIQPRLALLAEYPVPLQQILARLLSRHRNARHASADELWRDLISVARSQAYPDVTLEEIVRATKVSGTQLSQMLDEAVLPTEREHTNNPHTAPMGTLTGEQSAVRTSSRSALLVASGLAVLLLLLLLLLVLLMWHWTPGSFQGTYLASIVGLPDTESASPESLEAAQLSLSSVPPGARITVGEHSLEALTPTTLPLPFDRSTIPIQLDLPGFRSFRKELRYRSGQVLSLNPTLEPLVQLGTLELDSDPPGAHIFLNQKTTGFKTPSTLKEVDASRPQGIVLRLQGYKPWTQEVAVSAGGMTQLMATLERKTGEPTPRKLVTERSSPTGSAEPVPSSARSVTTAPLPRGGSGARPKTATLILNTIPPDAEVFVDGRRMGEVPLGLVLPIGSHRVELVSLDGINRKETVVKLREGENRKVIWDFQEAIWKAR